ncbi:uncharacterized protein B0T15DRAFT_104933 [Chaetomium strumarium]|uniref:FAD-binding PCMH-type domain-containing protein n=1 Tax=Chaetomium strumarium TaxID=1170767 RepID=A0AAJ0GY88_9PEZI|nr:hypothetical protein B0T15DRAFT_104933 [Chaetomium strumarium]
MHHLAPLTALLGLWAGISSSSSSSSSHTSPSPSPFDNNNNKAGSLSDCLAKAGVPVDASGSADYQLDISSFNLRLNYTPVAVAAVTTAQHVRDAVACARQVGVKANAKCGGHSYASFGLGGEDGHLVIEMSRMNRVVLDNATGIATAEGGTRLGHLAWELWNQGGRAISHGTCPGVGAGGHVLHGGYGVSSHTHGLALDWLVGATVVLANSSVVHCSETENPDLFWALRGAGGSMGVVTEFRFKTFQPPPKLTYFVASVRWPTEARALAGLKAVQEFAGTMPAELNMRLFIASRFVNLEGLYYGGKAGLQAALAPLIEKTNATLALAQEGGWLDQIKHFGGGGNIDQGHGHEEHENFYSTSLYTNALNDAQLQRFVNYWFSQGKATNNNNNTTIKRDWYVQIDLHGGPHSAVSLQPANYTAYAHREYLLLYLFYDRVDKGVPYPADGHAFTQRFVGNITMDMDRAGWGMYVNYPDSGLDQREAQVNYWGSGGGAHLARLQAIKRAVDPEDVFHYPQGILPA